MKTDGQVLTLRLVAVFLWRRKKGLRMALEQKPVINIIYHLYCETCTAMWTQLWCAGTRHWMTWTPAKLRCICVSKCTLSTLEYFFQVAVQTLVNIMIVQMWTMPAAVCGLLLLGQGITWLPVVVQRPPDVGLPLPNCCRWGPYGFIFLVTYCTVWPPKEDQLARTFNYLVASG